MIGREQLDELRRRILDEAGLGMTPPRVSTEIARLLTDLYVELHAALLENELLRTMRSAGGDAVVDVEVRPENGPRG